MVTSGGHLLRGVGWDGGDGEPQKATVMMMIGNVGGGGEGF